MKLKHNMKLLVYEHYQVKDMKLKHNMKLLVYEHYQVVLVSCLLLGSVHIPAVLCHEKT